MPASPRNQHPEGQSRTFYQPHVVVKVLQRAGDPTSWSQGNLAAMELVVAGPKIEVAIKWRFLSRILGCTWVFDAPHTRLEIISMPSPFWRPRKWIILRTGAGAKRRDMVAVTEDSALNEIWEGLLEAGANATSKGPAP